LFVKSALCGNYKKYAEKDNIIWIIRALRYGYGSAIRFADSSFSSRSCLLPVRNKKNDRCNAVSKCAGMGDTYCGKVRKKKNLSAILWRVRRGGRIISGLTLNPRQRVLHTRPFRCRGPTCVPSSLWRGSLFALSRVSNEWMNNCTYT